MSSLSGKTAIVTGGSRGIGFAIARALVVEGMNVAITGRDEGHLSRARKAIEAAGPGRLETFTSDVRSYGDMQRVVTATATRFGRLDVLVNNAGIGIFGNVADLTPEQWSAVIDTN